MAIEFSLILSGPTAPEGIISRLHPAESGRPEFIRLDGIWVADERERLGFILRLRQGEQGYFEAEAGDEVWTWEPDVYVNLGFVLEKEAPRPTAYRQMLEMVERVLATGNEDAALIQNGNYLLLRRRAGKLHRVPAGFWNSLDRSQIPDSLQAGS
jgi:hypothetical protein